jgi:release factor glutamine methyltransferase
VTTRAALESELAVRLESASEARWLLDEVLGRGRCRAGQLSDAAVRTIDAMAARRLSGEPLQYVLGSWAFRTLELAVDRRALIPRPETEQVVEAALCELRRPDAPRSGTAGAVVVDLGTGTGAIALSIAAEEESATVWATDVDAGALALAAENRTHLEMAHPSAGARVWLRHGSWFDALAPTLRGHVDLVVSNPPYVSESEWPALEESVRREPKHALVSAAGGDGTPGFACVETVLLGAAAWLAPGGAVVVELAEHQAAAARRLAARAGYRAVRTMADLAGRERAVLGRR